MAARKMHADELEIDAARVRRLLMAQFPQWADLPLAAVRSAGTDNALFRLGDDLAVRLPRIAGSVGQVDMEQQWLPQLAPFLPLAIPVPLAKGAPGADYPWPWSVYHWIEGDNATHDHITDPAQVATTLAQFIAAMQRIDPTGGPPPRPDNSFRGGPLVRRDEPARAAIAALHGALDTDAATAAWATALRAPLWDGPPRWIHGDLQSGNLLAQQGRLTAVIDFGCLAVGDPACDLQPAWNLLTAETRPIFRAALGVDDATWARGRGWALSVGLIALPYYWETNPVLANIARRTIAEVLADAAHDPRL